MVGVVVAAIGLLYLLATRSFLTRAVVMGQIGSLLGGEADAESVVVDLDGHVTIRRATLRAPGVEGTGGVVFSIARLRADFEIGSVLRGDPVVHSIELDNPVARISQSIDDGSVNLAALHPKKLRPGGGVKVVPRVLVRDGVIELGEHVTRPEQHGAGTPAYTSLKRIAVSGEVQQSPDASGASMVSFRQIEEVGVPSALPGGLNVRGRVAPDAVALELEGMSLSGWTPESAPTASRDLFRRSALEGEISKATITYTYAGGWEARILLNGVAMNLPLKARPAQGLAGEPIPLPEGDRERLLRMDGVSGEIVYTDKGVGGTLTGMIEELPYEVTFRVDGTSADAPFTCTLISRAFELKRDPQLLRFAPGVARRRLHQFSDPTGIVDATVTVRRGPPVDGHAAEVEVDGLLTLRDVTAAFERFPYRFEKLTGGLAFTDDRIELREIRGVSSAGAKVVANGVISPLTEAAAVDLDIVVTDLPIDTQLAVAMRGRKRLVDAIFSREKEAALRDAGLIASPADSARWRADLDALEAAGNGASGDATALRDRLARPVFEVGGTAKVRVQVTRAHSTTSTWSDVVTIELPTAGILTDKFPYPLLATGVTIVKTDDAAVVTGGTYRGLAGGEARIAARVDLARADDPDLAFLPDVEVAATGLPVDRLLIAALPTIEGLSGDRSLRAMLTRLGLDGVVDADVRIGLLPGDRPGYSVKVDAAGLRAMPAAPDGPPRLSLVDIRGHLDVDQDGMTLDLSSGLRPIAEPMEAVGVPVASAATATATIRFGGPGPESSSTSSMDIRAVATGLDLATPVEDLVRVFSPDAAPPLDTLRAAHAPAGHADVVAILTRAGDAPVETTIEFADAAGAEATFLGGRLGLTDTDGTITVRVPGAASPADAAALPPASPDALAEGPRPSRGSVETRGFQGLLRFDGVDAGRLSVEGVIGTDGRPTGPDASLAIALRDGRFESGLVRALLTARAPAVADFAQPADLRGTFDFDLALRTGAGSRPPAWEMRGVLTPGDLGLLLDGTPITLRRTGGTVEFDGAGGHLRALTLAAPQWTVSAEGSWAGEEGGGVTFQTALDLNAASLAPDLRAALPAPVRDLLATMNLDVAGPLRAEGVQVALRTLPDRSIGAVKVGGGVRVEDASFEAGLGFTGVAGVADFAFSRPDPAAPAAYEVSALLDRLTAGGVHMTDGRARVVSGDSGQILVPYAEAAVHGGRATASASLTAPSGEGNPRGYDANLELADVRFASLVADFEAAAPASAVRATVDAAPGEADPAPDGSRGLLDGRITLSGVAGDETSRRGRGRFTIGGGRIVNIPLLVPLVRITNLQFPMSERLDYALADFYVEGPIINFEEISVSSPSVALYGYGTASWPATELDLRFRSKSRRRIPLVTSVVENVRDELVTAIVSGTLRDPAVSVSAFGGSRRFLGSLFGADPSAQEQRLRQIEDRAERTPPRERPDTVTPSGG